MGWLNCEHIQSPDMSAHPAASPLLLLGTNYHPASLEVHGGHRNAASSLEAFPRTFLVNQQFAGDAFDVVVLRTVPCLNSDSRRTTGRNGTRKPMARKVFDSLANLAAETEHPSLPESMQTFQYQRM